MPYLSERSLSGLKQYQYKPGNYTVLDELHQPLWNYIITLFPTWFAPNLITLTGTFCLIASYVLTAYYIPCFTEVAPTWVYVANGVAVFLYLHLDCLDGKQARRTKSSSPLGQLFDHGCDALAIHLILTTLAACLQSGWSWVTIACVLGPMVPFIGAQWEEYQTGVMLYGAGIWGVTEANYAAVILQWFTAAAGPSFWLLDVAQCIPFLPQGVLKTRDIIALGCIAGGVWTAVPQTYRVLFNREIVLPQKERGNKELGQLAALSHFVQIVLMFTLGLVMLCDPLEDGLQRRWVMGLFGVIFGLQTTRLIVAHMTKEPFEMTWWPFFVMGVQVLNSRLMVVDGVLLSAVLYILTVIGYLHYVLSVVNEVCLALNIKCLTIKPAVD